MRRSLYSVLGVTERATEREIRKAYRKLAKTVHPDNKATADPRRFREVQQAYLVLADANKRAIYDRYGFEAAGLKLDRSFYDPRCEDGADVVVTVNLAFEEGAFGCVHDFPVKRFVTCSACQGSGTHLGTADSTCSMCRNKLSITRSRFAGGVRLQERVACPACNGSGLGMTQPCRVCKRRGIVPSVSHLKLKVLPGTDTGTVMRVRGKGSHGRFGGLKGNLFVRFNVAQSGNGISRDGADLYSEIVIPYWLAVLGGSLLWDGDRDKPFDTSIAHFQEGITVPPGTQHGDVLELQFQGLPTPGKPGLRGHHFVTINVELPRPDASVLSHAKAPSFDNCVYASSVLAPPLEPQLSRLTSAQAATLHQLRALQQGYAPSGKAGVNRS